MHELEELSLDFIADDTQAGFRLRRLEVFNWGTFDGRVWTLRLDGRNGLLTGDIGSGKSTLVDALTVLLVPTQRITFNRAAGADTRERTLRSYVLGHYKSERNDLSGSSRPVGLRDHNNYSVILGVFHNEGYQQTVTLAVVFYWGQNPQGQPERLYVASEGDLSITSEFSRFGSIAALRKRLRAAGAECHDSYPPYGAWFRRRFGIQNEQALDLFYQTVSMKSVGNLTDFVRGHMLEPFAVEPRIKALIEHFDDLNRAHEAVLKARRQIELLTPLVNDSVRHAELTAETERLRGCREALKPWFAGLKALLLDRRIESLAEDAARQQAKNDRLEERQRALRTQAVELQASIFEQGGNRIEQLERQIAQREIEKRARLEKHGRYVELAGAAGIAPADGDEAFVVQRGEIEALREAAAARESELQNELTEQEVTMRQGREELRLLTVEIDSLKARRSNIDSTQVKIREALCAALGLEEQDLPFAGELIRVREEERDWEGAIERVMRNFGLSLLVPDEEYTRVADWVDRTHLKGLLVYFRVRGDGRAPIPTPHAHALARKVDIRPESPFYPWLEQRIAQRFDHVCCATQEQFRRESKAITRAGQIKAPGERHEKDDRHRIDDRERYVLGWDNRDKIEALEQKARLLEASIATIGGRIAALQKEQQAISERRAALDKLGEYRSFQELDWKPVALEIEQLKEEKQRLEAASDLLRALTERLRAVEADETEVNREIKERIARHSSFVEKRAAAEELRRQARETHEAGGSLTGHYDALTALRAEALGDRQLTVESCDSREQEMREWLQARIDAEDKRLQRMRDRIIDAMRSYKEEFKLETREVDVAIEAAGEYGAMLSELVGNDLPRFERRFKELLNETAIREIANFHGQLAREREQIRERIDRINASMTQIDFNPGRYIRLEAEPTHDTEIRDFLTELRSCTEGELTGSTDEEYTEKKFLQVRKIIERFRGRTGLSEIDRRWTTKVTDVRNWFVFAGSERWRADDTEDQHHSDSSGKSGGQKEKLAYTVLAASLAYQFGLEWGEVRSRSFRFVVIDEAFGRGSDESTRYALELFARLNLQLLIITPLQKINVIEPYVAAVGFVHNQEGRASVLRNLTIDEYRAEKAREGA